MQKQAKLTSKGQITIPREIRRILGIEAGDRLLFETDSKGVRVQPARRKGSFAKYQGIGTPGIRGEREGITAWLREMRGHDDRD